MTFAAQADATRCAELSTFPELASFRQMPLQVSSAENPGRVSIKRKLASFRQMPLQADQQPPQERGSREHRAGGGADSDAQLRVGSRRGHRAGHGFERGSAA